MDIKDKVIIVTGASSGIGLAAAKFLTSQGAKVALAARSADKLSQLSKQLAGSLAVPTDMTKPEQISALVKTVQDHYGKIDVLVNNAGQGYDAPIADITEPTLQALFNLDFVGPLLAMQRVIPLMKAQGGGAIVNISSGLALMHLPNMSAYAAVKAALAHLSLTAREELKKDKISVSVVYPYITDTDFEKNTIKEGHSDWSSNGSYEPPKSDSAEHVAELIADCIKSGQAEAFAHPWMNQPRS
jgi:short-subunit dehydrogenase